MKLYVFLDKKLSRLIITEYTLNEDNDSDNNYTKLLRVKGPSQYYNDMLNHCNAFCIGFIYGNKYTSDIENRKEEFIRVDVHRVFGIKREKFEKCYNINE